MSKTKYRMMNALTLFVLVLTSVFCVANTAYGNVSSDNDISSMSWQEISDLADQIAIDVAAHPEKSEVYQAEYLGKEKTFTYGGYNVTARIVGIAQDTLQDGSMCGFTFEIYKGMPTHNMNSSDTTNGGYASTAMKTWLEGLAFPADLQPHLKEFAVKYRTSTSSAASTLYAKVALCSASNLYWAGCQGEKGYSSYFHSDEGEPYQYFKKNDTTDARIHYNDSGSVCDAWLLSPHSSTSFVVASSNGDAYNGGASGSGLPTPRFCLGTSMAKVIAPQLKKQVKNASAWTFTDDASTGEQGNFTFKLTQGETSDADTIKDKLPDTVQVKQGVLPAIADATTASDGSVKWDGIKVDNAAYVYRVTETDPNRKDMICDTSSHKLVVMNHVVDIATASWKDISDLADQVARDVAAHPENSEVYQEDYLGREKTFTYGGYDVTARIVGIAQDTLQDGGKCGFTFEIYKGMPKHSMNDTETTSGGYASTAMKTWLEGLAFPPDLEPYLKTFAVKYRITPTDAASTLYTKVALCSASNLYWKGCQGENSYSSYFYSDEGEPYQYFKKNDTLQARIHYNNEGSAYDAWLLSPHSSTIFMVAYSSGNVHGHYASYSRLPTPRFCLGSSI